MRLSVRGCTEMVRLALRPKIVGIYCSDVLNHYEKFIVWDVLKYSVSLPQRYWMELG